MLKAKQILLLTLLGTVLSACANNNDQNQQTNGDSIQELAIIPVTMAPKKDETEILNDYESYRLTMESLRQKQTDAAYRFLATQMGRRNSMVSKARLGLLRVLGKNAAWTEFLSQYALLEKETQDLEVNCYAAIAGHASVLSLDSFAKQLVKSNEKLSEGCNKMIEVAASRGLLSNADAWRRVRILISHNSLSMARDLVSAIGVSMSTDTWTSGEKSEKISRITPIITSRGRNRPDIDGFVYSLYGQVDQDDIGFVEGIVGLSKARDLDMDSALQHFNKADKSQLSNEQWEWYARAALRLGNWSQLNQIISSMPEVLRNTPTWWYWQARAKVVMGDKASAVPLYEKAAESGRNFYAILAHEELGRALNVKSNTSGKNKAAVDALAQDDQIHRSLVLFKNSLYSGDREMRTAAQEQWRFAVKNFTDDRLIMASELALRNQFYEMSIYSADISDSRLNYSLRFPAPFKNIVDKYARNYGVDMAWIFGLIRQESRFATLAHSSVGASGLMQIMPATAGLIAKKIGLEDYDMNNIDTNVHMGVWYLYDLYKYFYSEPLVISAYNAGPGRAKKWRQSGLEGAIYAETIPFNETRDYVKKVMSNTVYYSHMFGLSKRSLKSRLGTI